MDKFSYEKSGRITLIGFVIFSLVVIWLVNVYFEGEKDYKQETIDVQMSKGILLESKQIDDIFGSMHQNLYTQKEWLKRVLTEEPTRKGLKLFSGLIYLQEEDVSIIDDALVGNSKEIGNIILRGDKEQTNYDVRFEINKLSDFFQIERILYEQLSYEMNTIYYSKNQYVTYYPYLKIGDKNIEYEAVFKSVDSLIDKIQELDKTDPNFDIEHGWDRASLDDSSAKNLTFTTAMPIVTAGKINGILTGTINEAVVSAVFSDINPKAECYLIDENETIIFTNNSRIVDLSNLTDAFSQSYEDLRYYRNKFPTELETRYEKDHTLYITNLDKKGWQLIYVVDQKNTQTTVRIVILNIVLLSLVVGVVYFGLFYASKKRNNIEDIIQDSKLDGMTELLNHKNIIEALRKIIRNRRIKRIAVMMIDLDDFKKINDAFGHGIGDDVIRLCSEVLKKVVAEKNAVCGRYGGEEFMAVISGISNEEANNIADQIRILFNQKILDQMGLDVTLSIGMFYVTKPFKMNEEELINEADKNLYKAKNSGKNKVEYQ